MTKRRAENVCPPEIPHKRCLRSRCATADKAGGGEAVGKKRDPPNVGQRCRKRPNRNGDDEPLDTENLPRKVPANGVHAVLGDAGKQTQQDPGDKVMNTVEDLSAFNTFQFWRVPLPELDLSLLETEPSAVPTAALSTKDLEAMET